MSDVLAGASLPPGYSSVNPFAVIRGPEAAARFIAFVCDAFEGRETLAAHTIDSDELLIHAEIRVGDSTVMCCDAKPDWRFTPALLQVYVSDADAVLDRALSGGATVFTEPSPFFGKQRLARFQDPWHNLWWLFEFGPESSAPSQAPNELPGWRPDPDAPRATHTPRSPRRCGISPHLRRTRTDANCVTAAPSPLRPRGSRFRLRPRLDPEQKL